MRRFVRDLVAVVRQLCILAQHRYELYQAERFARMCNRFLPNN